MIPWDFGLINAIKEKTNFEIYPDDAFQIDKNDQYKDDKYFVFSQKNVQIGTNGTAKIDFSIKTHHKEFVTFPSKLIKIFNNALYTEVALKINNNSYIIGYAKIKINSLEFSTKDIILNLSAMIRIIPIYEDEV